MMDGCNRKDSRAGKRFSRAKSKIYSRWVETDGYFWKANKDPGKPTLKIYIQAERSFGVEDHRQKIRDQKSKTKRKLWE